MTGSGLAAIVASMGVTLIVLAAPGAAPAATGSPRLAPQEPTTPAPTPSADGCQPQALLEAPVPEGILRGVVTVGGWAVDLASPAGTGVSEVHVYLDGYGSEAGHTFIGRAEYGGTRVDVAQLFNDARFARSAFSLSWDASTAGAGTHTLVVLYRTRCGWTSLTQTVEVDGPTILLTIESPPQGSPISAPVRIQGWTADPLAQVGTGIEQVDFYLDGQITTRGVPLGTVTYGETRPDVGAALGRDSEAARGRFSRSGFALLWNPTGVVPGTHSLTFYARSAEGAVARSLTLEVTAAAAVAGTRTPSTVVGVATPARGAESFAVAVGATTATAVTLSWTPVAGASSYAVYASQGVAVFSPVQTNILETTVTLGGLAPGRSYRLFVRALDSAGNELAQSNTVTVTTSPTAATSTPGPTGTPRAGRTEPNAF